MRIAGERTSRQPAVLSATSDNGRRRSGGVKLKTAGLRPRVAGARASFPAEAGGSSYGIQNPAAALALLGTLFRDINLASGDLTAILETLAKTLATRLGIDALAVWTIDEGTNFMKIETSFGLSERYVKFFNKTDRIRVGQGLVGRVMSERKTLSIRDLDEYKGIGIVRWNDMLREEGIVSVLAVPIFVGDKILGALNSYYKGPPHMFDRSEELLTEIIGNQVAVAFENIRTYTVIEKDRERLSAQIARLLDLQQVVKLLNLHLYDSLSDSLRHLGEYLKKEFSVSAVAIFQKSDRDGLIRLVAHNGLSPDFLLQIQKLEIRPGPGTLTGLAYAEGSPQTTPRAMTDDRITKENKTLLTVAGMVALGAFPMLARDRVTGVLVVFYDRMHEFSEQEVSVLNTFSQFIGVSLENIRIFQSLVSEKQKTTAMLYSLHDGIIVYDLAGKIIEMNPRAEELLLLKKETVVGQTGAELFRVSQENSRDTKSVAIENTARISSLLLGDFEMQEITLVEPAHMVFAVTYLPLRNEENTKMGFLFVLHDSTDEKAVEILKSQFVSTASHQMRTPLTGMKWGLSQLLKEGRLSDMQEALAKKVLENTETVIGLVNDLLDVSRIEEGRFGLVFEMHDIFAIIEKIVRDLDFSIKKGEIVFTMHAPKTSLPVVSVDKDRVEIAIKNVIDNAIKYTLPGGAVDVRFSVSSDALSVMVEDSGIGIPKEEQKLLFNKFFRAKNAVRLQNQGSGLGLYIAKNIIEKHNGKISVLSAEKKGSTFVLQFPLRPEIMPRGIIRGL